MSPLRFTTWLAPGLPLGLFETIAAHVGAGLGFEHELTVDASHSGPTRAEHDRFADGQTDVGFLCPPSYLWLTAQRRPSVELVPLAPVYDDPRADGRPVYFSDVVVRADSRITCFDDLKDRRIGFNDHSSLSGYLSVLLRLAADGLDPAFFGQFVACGSHRRALDLITAGDIDAAAIDANVWRAVQAERPEQAAVMQSVDTLGRYPVQPIVVRADLDGQLLERIAEELRQPSLHEALRPFGVTGFAPVSHRTYEDLRPAIDALGPVTPPSGCGPA